MDVKTITDAMGFTRNYWSIVENDRRILSEIHLDKIVELFEFDRDEGRELLNLRSHAKKRGWWTQYSALLDDSMVRLLGMEYGASAIRAYEGGVITGLLQTEDYARAELSASVFVPPADVDQLVEVRMSRQRRLFEEDPPQLSVLLDEGTLLRQVGGPQVQREQLRHLLEMMDRHPTLDLRVLPFSATGRGIAGASTFYLMDFPSKHLPTLGWYETVTFTGFIEDSTAVRDLNVIYAQALEEADDARNSLNRIQSAMDAIQLQP
jgi:hypothetical protein